MERTDGHDQRLHGRELAADHCLEVHNSGSAADRGVNAGLGTRAVACLALNGGDESVGGGVMGTCAAGDKTALLHDADMYAEDAVNTLEAALLDGQGGSLADLFGGLEDDFDGPAKIIFDLIQRDTGVESQGCVSIMAARMHGAVMD